MYYIKNDRTRELLANVYSKIRFIDGRDVSDERFSKAREIYSDVVTEIRESDEVNNEQINERIKECRSLLNRVMSKHFGTASLTKLCDWK